MHNSLPIFKELQKTPAAGEGRSTSELSANLIHCSAGLMHKNCVWCRTHITGHPDVQRRHENGPVCGRTQVHDATNIICHSSVIHCHHVSTKDLADSLSQAEVPI